MKRCYEKLSSAEASAQVFLIEYDRRTRSGKLSMKTCGAKLCLSACTQFYAVIKHAISIISNAYSLVYIFIVHNITILQALHL